MYDQFVKWLLYIGEYIIYNWNKINLLLVVGFIRTSKMRFESNILHVTDKKIRFAYNESNIGNISDSYTVRCF